MLPLGRQLRRKVRWHAWRTAMLSVGGVLLAIGGGFLVAAVWMGLVPLLGMPQTALVLGASFVGAGLICLVLRSAPKAPGADADARTLSGAGAPPRPDPRLSPVMEVILFGVAVYLQTRRR